MPSISENATCIDGIAANGLKSTSVDPVSWSTPVNAWTESVNPHSGSIRGGAVGTSTYSTSAMPMATMNMLRTK